MCGERTQRRALVVIASSFARQTRLRAAPCAYDVGAIHLFIACAHNRLVFSPGFVPILLFLPLLAPFPSVVTAHTNRRKRVCYVRRFLNQYLRALVGLKFSALREALGGGERSLKSSQQPQLEGVRSSLRLVNVWLI